MSDSTDATRSGGSSGLPPARTAVVLQVLGLGVGLVGYIPSAFMVAYCSGLCLTMSYRHDLGSAMIALPVVVPAVCLLASALVWATRPDRTAPPSTGRTRVVWGITLVGFFLVLADYLLILSGSD